MATADPNAYDETVVRECMARWKAWSEDESLASLFEVHVYRHIRKQDARIAELEDATRYWPTLDEHSSTFDQLASGLPLTQVVQMLLAGVDTAALDEAIWDVIRERGYLVGEDSVYRQTERGILRVTRPDGTPEYRAFFASGDGTISERVEDIIYGEEED